VLLIFLHLKFINVNNKLECSSLAGLSSLVRSQPYSGAGERYLTRVGSGITRKFYTMLKGLPGTNDFTYAQLW